MSQHPFYNIESTAVSTVMCACIWFHFHDLAHIRGTTNFIENSKSYFLQTRPSETVHTSWKYIQPIWFILAQFHPKEVMSQLLCFDIENWLSYNTIPV